MHFSSTTEKLNVMQEKYNQLFENANDAVYVFELTEDGFPSHFSEVNKVALTRLGYDKQQLLTLSLLEITCPESMNPMIRSMKQLLEKGKCVYQATHITKHRLKIPVEIRTNLFQVNGKNIVIAIEHDLLEKRWIERRINKAVEQYTSLVNYNPDIVYSLDLKGKIIFINKAGCELTGYPVEAMLKTPFFEFVKENQRQKAIAYFTAAKKGKPKSYEVDIQTSAGKFATLQVTNIPIVVEGNIEGIYGIGKDITLRKQAEEELRFTQQELKKTNKKLLEAQRIAQIGNWEWVIRTKKMNYWSKQINKILGIPLQENFTFKKFLQIVHPADRELVINSVRQAITERSHYSMETRLLLQDGKERYINVQAVVVYDELNQPSCIVGTVQDITERKNTEELLRKSEKLRVAGQLAAGVAHEIRNPLASIKGFLQLMQMGIHKPDYTNIMLSEAERMEAIIDEFLVLAKPQAVTFDYIDIGNLQDNVCTLLNTQAILKNIQVLQEIDPDIPLLYCDENQIKQMYINLLKNGIEAMDEGGVIRIKTSCENGNIISKIIDYGCGIEQERLNLIAEPFYSTKEKGTGLGLMVTQKIISEHNGQLKIQSEVNQGTTVEVHLPVG